MSRLLGVECGRESPSVSRVPAAHVQHDGTVLDVLEDVDGLCVCEALQGVAVHRQDLVTCDWKVVRIYLRDKEVNLPL